MLRSRRALALMATMGLLLSLLAILPKSDVAVAATGRFPDVTPTNPFAEAIDWLADAGVTGGYADGGFHPADPITRQAMAAFLHRYGQATTGGADPGFDDVPPSHAFREEIWWLAEQGITGGYADGGFHPTAAITRQSIAAFLYRYQISSPGAVDPGFTDVPPTHPFAEEIWWLAEEGITTGYPDGGFHPEAAISRQAMAAFLFRMAGDPALGSPGTNRVDTDAAAIIDADDAVSNVAAGDGTGTLVLATATDPLPSVGEVIVLDATDAVPAGALGTVTAVTPGPSGVTVGYGPAAVEEAVPEADITLTRELFSDETSGSGPSRIGGIVNLAGTGCNGAFNATVDVSAGASLDFRASWGPSASARVLRLALNINASAVATADAALAADCTQNIDLDPWLPPTALPAVPLPGPLPPIQPMLEWNALLEGSGGSNIHFSGTAGFSGRYGAEYIDGKAGLINETQVTGTASLAGTSPTGRAHAFVGPRVSFSYVGILDGWVEAGPFVDGEYDGMNGGHWAIRGGLEAAASVNADLWLLGSYSWSSPRLALLTVLLASGGTPVVNNALISHNGVGIEADSRVYLDGISQDGHHVLFHSNATNLPDADGLTHYWWRDTTADGTLRMIPELDAASTAITPVLTDDGAEIIFQSTAGFVDGPTGTMAVYAISTSTGAIDWISEVPPGLVAGSMTGGQSIVATDRTGRYVLFRVTEMLTPPNCRDSYAPGITDCFMPHYLRVDRWTGEVTDAWYGSQTMPGYLGGVTYEDRSATIDFTGRYAVIAGNYGHLLGYDAATDRYGVTNFKVVLVLDMIDQSIFVGSENGVAVPANGQTDGGPHISESGRYIAFASDASNLGVGDSNGVTDIYVRDIFDDEWRRASIDGDGTQMEGASTDPTISANGAFVAFRSADPLVEGLITSGAYVRDRDAGVTCEVAVGLDDTTPDQPVSNAIMTSDGFYVGFTTDATNMIGVAIPTPNAYRVLNRCL